MSERLWEESPICSACGQSPERVAKLEAENAKLRRTMVWIHDMSLLHEDEQDEHKMLDRLLEIAILSKT